VALAVFVFRVSLWNPSAPPVVTYTYPMELPAASRNRSRLTWLDWLLISKATRAYPSAKVLLNVLRAIVLPFVVLPSAAKPPVRASVLSGLRPDDDVHADSVPDSNPSANTGTAAAAVVTGAAALSAERLFDASRARTV